MKCLSATMTMTDLKTMEMIFTPTTRLTTTPTITPTGETTETKKSPAKYYQLTQRQYDMLWNAANSDNQGFRVPYPKPDDTLDKASYMRALSLEFEDLLNLGFLTDISAYCAAKVKHAWESEQRQVRFFAISHIGQAMFEDDGYIEVRDSGEVIEHTRRPN